MQNYGPFANCHLTPEVGRWLNEIYGAFQKNPHGAGLPPFSREIRDWLFGVCRAYAGVAITEQTLRQARDATIAHLSELVDAIHVAAVEDAGRDRLANLHKAAREMFNQERDGRGHAKKRKPVDGKFVSPK